MLPHLSASEVSSQNNVWTNHSRLNSCNIETIFSDDSHDSGVFISFFIGTKGKQKAAIFPSNRYISKKLNDGLLSAPPKKVI